MADEYTPTTDEMADAYTQMRVREAKGEPGTERLWTAMDALSEFNRGLAAYEVEVRERIAQDIEAVPHGHRALYPASHFANIARGATR